VKLLLHVIKIFIQIALLFVFYFIGVWIQQSFIPFIPGSVIGLVLMFFFLLTGALKSNWIDRGARFMNQHLVLFFIPATVGLLNYYVLFKGKGLLLIVITIFSTILVMVSAGITSQMLAKRKDYHNE